MRYKNDRKEPSHLEPHQLAFIIEHGYLPNYDKTGANRFTISHCCHLHETSRKKKRRFTCINVDHMSVESIKVNCSRKTCFNFLHKERARWRRSCNKKVNGEQLICSICVNHSPPCFLSVGHPCE